MTNAGKNKHLIIFPVKDYTGNIIRCFNTIKINNMKKTAISLLIILLFQGISFASQYHSIGRNAYVYRNYAKARENFLKDVEISGSGDSYYFLGEIEKIDKNYDLAIQYFTAAVSKNTSRKFLINSYWNLIILYEERGDYPNYIKYCREFWFKTRDSSAKQKIDSLINKLLWSDNEEAVKKYNEGIALSSRGDSTNAVSSFRDAINIDSLFLAPKFELGMIAYKAGNQSDAMHYLSPIAERIPFYAEVQMILGNINFNNRNYSAAITNFTSVLEYGFIDRDTEYNSVLKRGTCYYHTGDFDNAEKDISSVAESVKGNNEPLVLLAAIYIKKKNLDSALKILSRAESISANDPVVLFQTGSIYYYRDDEKYAPYFDRLHDAVKDNNTEYQKYTKAFKLLMNYHFNKKNYTRSLEISEKIQSGASDYEAIITAARSNHYLGKHEDAIAAFKKISLQNSSDRVLLAASLAATGRKEQALELLKNLQYDQKAYSEAMKSSMLLPLIKEIEKAAEQSRKEQINKSVTPVKQP